jgi:hypothetical protein
MRKQEKSIKRIIEPQYLVEPQNIVGYVERSSRPDRILSPALHRLGRAEFTYRETSRAPLFFMIKNGEPLQLPDEDI